MSFPEVRKVVQEVTMEMMHPVPLPNVEERFFTGLPGEHGTNVNLCCRGFWSFGQEGIKSVVALTEFVFEGLWSRIFLQGSRPSAQRSSSS